MKCNRLWTISSIPLVIIAIRNSHYLMKPLVTNSDTAYRCYTRNYDTFKSLFLTLANEE